MRHDTIGSVRRGSRAWSVAVVMICLVWPAAAGAADAEMPFGMTVDYLNLVLSTTDGEAVAEFYGDVLGLERLETWPMSKNDPVPPGPARMVRFQAGASQLKFIEASESRPRFPGGAGDARGIRLLALLLPVSQRAGIEARFTEHGLDPVDYTQRETYAFGMAYDPDGNQVEIVFLDDSVGEDVFQQIQIGLTVGDADAMNAYLSDVIGLPKVSANPSPSSGAVIHRYAVGRSQIKFWQGRDGLPAHVGGPWELQGMSLLQFIVPDVDAVRSAILARGGTIYREPFKLGGSTIMFANGPDGIVFEFAGPLLDRLR